MLTVGADALADPIAATVVKRNIAAFGGVDISRERPHQMICKPLAELVAADWRRMLDVNLVGATLFTAEALRRMDPGSARVNVASVRLRWTSPLVTPYAEVKAALVSLTR